MKKYQFKNTFLGLYYPPFSFKPKEGKIYVTDLNVSPVKLLETKIIADHDLKLNLHGLDLIEVRYFIKHFRENCTNKKSILLN